MRPSFRLKLAISVPLLAALLLLDTVAALQGLPALLAALGVALLAVERLRVWLKAHGRATLAMLPFMAAALVLLLAFCRGRNLSQGVLLLVTIAVVFDILLIALAVIGETTKRRLRGLAEFVGLTCLGLALGLALSLLFLLEAGWRAGASLAGP